MAQFKVISSSISTGYTGSISKMLSLGNDGSTVTIERIEWGNFVEPESLFTPTSITSRMDVAAGSYVDGPIGRVKTGSEGGWLIYIEK